MKSLNIRGYYLTTIFILCTNISIIYSQKIGKTNSSGSDINWSGDFLFDGVQLEPLDSNHHSSLSMNEDKNFLQFGFSFPNPPSTKKVMYIRVTFHLEGDINNVASKGNLKYDSFRNDPSNLSHDNFAGPRSWNHLVKPNQFSVEVKQDVRQGNYYHTYYFNCIDANANLEIRKGSSDEYFYYKINFDINLIKAKPSDVGGKSLGNDLNTENTLKLNGGGSFVIPNIARD